MARARVIQGAAVVCYVNGKPFGRVSGFSFRSTTPHKPAMGIDCVDPQELMPTTTKCNGSLQLYRTISDAGAEGAGMTTHYEDLPRAKYWTLQLVDRGTDQVLFQAEMCVTISQSWNIPSRGIVTGSVDFESISWSNEFKQAL